MENENKVKAKETPQEAEGRMRGGLPVRNVGRYIRYVLFLVVIGLVYIWNSHVAEQQVRQEDRLRKEIESAKAEYKTMHAKLSAGTRKPIVGAGADSLGLALHTQNVYKLMRD